MVEKKEEDIKDVKEVKDSPKWIVAEIATQTEPVIVNQDSDKQFSVHDALVEVLNALDRISKAL